MAVQRLIATVKAVDEAGAVWPLKVIQQFRAKQKSETFKEPFGKKQFETFDGRRVYRTDATTFKVVGAGITLFSDSPALRVRAVSAATILRRSFWKAARRSTGKEVSHIISHRSNGIKK